MKEHERRRNQLVVKSNALVQKTRYQLTAIQQRTMLYIISMIKSDATLEDLTYEFSLTDYIKVCGQTDGAENYNTIRRTLGQLCRIGWEMQDDNGDMWTHVSWLNKAKGSEKKGTYIVRLDEDLMPYLIQLKNNFTQYELINILSLTSSYAIQLYEILKSYEWKHQWIVSCDDFRDIFQVDDKKSYNNWGDLKKRVIDCAIKQINEKTDLTVFYKDNCKRGKKATQLAFIIHSKSKEEYSKIKSAVHAELNGLFDDTPVDNDLLDWVNENKQKDTSKVQRKIKDTSEYDNLIESYRNQLEYEIMKEQFSQDIDKIDEMIAVMVDFELSEAEYIKVDGAKRSKSIVIASYHKLKMEHIEYVLWCMKETTTSIRNIKAYLQTALYNAPMSMDNWISQRVQHDLYGEK